MRSITSLAFSAQRIGDSTDCVLAAWFVFHQCDSASRKWMQLKSPMRLRSQVKMKMKWVSCSQILWTSKFTRHSSRSNAKIHQSTRRMPHSLVCSIDFPSFVPVLLILFLETDEGNDSDDADDKDKPSALPKSNVAHLLFSPSLALPFAFWFHASILEISRASRCA